MADPTADESDKYIRERYESAINYYWAASRSNKRWYKITRSLTVIFGALVTLVASLSSSEIIKDCETVKVLFALGTPILAAMLTVIAGFSQSFQWGSTWQNMVLTAQRLQNEYDAYLVTPKHERKYLEKSEKLNAFVINETESFFERMLGGAMPVADKRNNRNKGELEQ